MYSDLALYYLDQMGIRPWIRREHSVLEQTAQLLIFISAKQSPKAQTLLKQMLTYLDLPEHAVRIISIQEPALLSTYNERCPLAIWILGLTAEQLVHDVQPECSLIMGFSPEYLLAHPSGKRKAFQEMNQLKQIL